MCAGPWLQEFTDLRDRLNTSRVLMEDIKQVNNELDIRIAETGRDHPIPKVSERALARMAREAALAGGFIQWVTGPCKYCLFLPDHAGMFSFVLNSLLLELMCMSHSFDCIKHCRKPSYCKHFTHGVSNQGVNKQMRLQHKAHGNAHNAWSNKLVMCVTTALQDVVWLIAILT